MNVHISYKVPKTTDLEKDLNHQIEKIRKRLQVFRPELIHLKGVIEQTSAREGFIVSLNLRLPSGQMAVQKSAPGPAAAIRASFDDLLQQITKHKDSTQLVQVAPPAPGDRCPSRAASAFRADGGGGTGTHHLGR